MIQTNITTAMSESTASKFSSIPELLELVLVHLSFQELLTAQQVSTAWRNTIACSPTLQQSLFLSPIPDQAKRYLNVRPCGPLSLMTMGPRPSPSSFEQPVATLARPHPVFQEAGKHETISNSDCLKFRLDYKDLQKLLRLAPDSPYRGMFLSQPPSTEVALELEVQNPRTKQTEEIAPRRALLWDEDGVKLEAIGEVVTALLNSASNLGAQAAVHKTDGALRCDVDSILFSVDGYHCEKHWTWRCSKI
jgi:hypothetical protein